MIICLAVILFIMIRKFPATADIEEADLTIQKQTQPVAEELVAEPVEEVVPKYSEDIENLILESRKLIDDDKLQPAEDKLIEVIQKDLKCATAYTLLGDIYLKRLKKNEAEESYQAAIKNDPDEAAAHFGLGLILEEAGRLNDAVKEVSAAIRIDDQNDIWYHRLGELYMNLRMYSKAGMAYNKAANLRPDYVRYKELALQAEKKQISHKAQSR
jgi:tetratricopeptide (TPR) repeat protein